jgi:hypothetical protein
VRGGRRSGRAGRRAPPVERQRSSSPARTAPPEPPGGRLSTGVRRSVFNRHRYASEGLSLAHLVGFALWVSSGIANRELQLIIPKCVTLLVMGRTIAVARDKRGARPATRRSGVDGR